MEEKSYVSCSSGATYISVKTFQIPSLEGVHVQAEGRAQLVKAPAAKRAAVSLFLGAHMVRRREVTPTGGPLTSTHVSWCVHTTHTH